MALKDSWKDLEDATEGVAGSGDEISVKPINEIAHAVMELENQEPTQSNVQADWNEENPESPAYINNKPTILTEEEIKNIINPAPITEAPTTLETNKEYSLGELQELSIVFPSVASKGDVIYLTFKSGAVATTLAIDTTNTTDIEIVPEPNCYYDIFAKFNGSVWLVNYSEYLVSEV